MNEKIRELAKNVDAVFDVIAMGRHDGVLFTETELERFAELIVRECCNIFVELRTRPADLAVLDVKKHFGVE